MIQDNWLVYVVGFLAQILFSGRMIVQWFKSEKAGKPVSPAIFWQLSLLASMLLFIYGVLRKDFAIVIGQILVYFVYIRNLQLKNRWKMIPRLFRWVFYLLPVVSLSYLFSDTPNNIHALLRNEDIPTTLLIWGSLGQVVFTLRFVYQWIDSEHKRESVLSTPFWITSLFGSLMIISYAVFRYDPVLFVGQLTGTFVYTRNIFLSLELQGVFVPLMKNFIAKRKEKNENR